MRKSIIALILILGLGVGSCQKNKSKTIRIDVSTTDSTGSALANCEIFICYRKKNYLGDQVSGGIIGTTDSTGKFYTEWESPKKTNNYEVVIFEGASGFYCDNSIFWPEQNVNYHEVNYFDIQF